MAFTNNFRIERVYFEKLKSLIDVLKTYKDRTTEEPVRTLLENAIDVDGATLLLYRNLGEAWAELADLIQDTKKALQDLDDKAEAYHDELNERIDEANNYLMALIRALESRVDAIEADLSQMGRLFTYELNKTNDTYTLTESGKAVTFSTTSELFTHDRAHLVVVRGNVDGETTYFFPREYDTATNSGLFEWYAFGFVGDEIHEITVTLLPDNSVNVAVETTDFAAILSKLSELETLVNGFNDRITNLEEDVDTLEQNVEGFDLRISDLESDLGRFDYELYGENGVTERLGRLENFEETAEDTINLHTGQIEHIYEVKQNVLTAGDNITIDDNVISATGGGGIDIYAARGTGNGANIFNVTEGDNANVASGAYSTAEGQGNTTAAPVSHVEGQGNTIVISASAGHAEGYSTEVLGTNGHAEGTGTIARLNAHAEGSGCHAGDGTHTANAAHAEGLNTQALAVAAHSEGNGTSATASFSHAEGNGTHSAGQASHAEGNGCRTSAQFSHAEGNNTISGGDFSHAEGESTHTFSQSTHAEGFHTKAGDSSHDAKYAHAEGDTTQSLGEASHAEGANCITYQRGAHAEGVNSVATGVGSHAEGYNAQAVADSSHAEGVDTQAGGVGSHAEGRGTMANAHGSHAGGQDSTVVDGAECAFSHGSGTVAGGMRSTAFGNHTKTSFSDQFAFGRWNDPGTENDLYLETVGNGVSEEERSNARTLTSDGNETLTGFIFPQHGVKLQSANGTLWILSVNNEGELVIEQEGA